MQYSTATISARLQNLKSYHQNDTKTEWNNVLRDSTWRTSRIQSKPSSPLPIQSSLTLKTFSPTPLPHFHQLCYSILTSTHSFLTNTSTRSPFSPKLPHLQTFILTNTSPHNPIVKNTSTHHILTNLRSDVVDATLETKDEGRPNRWPMSSTCE